MICLYDRTYMTCWGRFDRGGACDTIDPVASDGWHARSDQSNDRKAHLPGRVTRAGLGLSLKKKCLVTTLAIKMRLKLPSF